MFEVARATFFTSSPTPLPPLQVYPHTPDLHSIREHPDTCRDCRQKRTLLEGQVERARAGTHSCLGLQQAQAPMALPVEERLQYVGCQVLVYTHKDDMRKVLCTCCSGSPPAVAASSRKTLDPGALGNSGRLLGRQFSRVFVTTCRVAMCEWQV